MAVYKLEENPDNFIAPSFWDNEFVYTIKRFNDRDNMTSLTHIDLKSDKLMIYGVEIKESILKRLHESLVFKSQAGFVYVNCNGACYFQALEKGIHRLVHSVVYDWSQFGIIIPNTVNDSLKTQLKEKKEELAQINELVSSMKAEALSRKTSLEASNHEVRELKEQLLECQKENQEIKLEMKKIGDKFPLTEFELEITKIELESYRKELPKLEDELSSTLEEIKNMEVELKKVRDQISSTNLEKVEIEKRAKGYEEKLLNTKKDREHMREELQAMKSKHSLEEHELQFTKRQLEFLEKKMGDYLLLIDSKVQSTNGKLDQLLTSALWSELGRFNLPKVIDFVSAPNESNSFCTLPISNDLSNMMGASFENCLTIEKIVHGELSNDIKDSDTHVK